MGSAGVFAPLRRPPEGGRRTGLGAVHHHLDRLTDLFVAQVGDRYVLQYAGHRVVDAVRSGVFHESPSVGPVEIRDACRRCGTALTFAYADHLATVACPACDAKLIEYPFDPGGFQDRSLPDAVGAFDRRTTYKWRLASGGVCFVCAGRVDVAYAASVADRRLWDLPFVTDADRVTVAARDPWTVRVEAPTREGALVARLGPEGTVESVTTTL